MRSLVLTLILTLLSISHSAHALRNSAKWKDNCENGIARACFEYGIWLQTMQDSKWRAEGARYVRRACAMAYSPACDAKAPPVVRAMQPAVLKHGYVQPQLPTEPVAGTSPVAQPKSTYVDPSFDDMKDIQQIQNYHNNLKKTAHSILRKGSGAGFRVDPSAEDTADGQPVVESGPPPMSVWERAGFRATPLMIRLVGARNFKLTGVEEDRK